MAVRLLAKRAGSAHALAIDHHGLLDDAAGLTEVVAEAADNPHLLRDILHNRDMHRLRTAQERSQDFRTTGSTAPSAAATARTRAGTCSCTGSRGAGTASGRSRAQPVRN
ncbi:MAG TPA: hypothetical protein VGU20_22680 [Stellaceae bacterium]|nr:hypothetical protein [Stellaceae bacterium]